MSKFLIRRLSLALLIFFMGVFVSYSVIRMMPSSYVETKARELSAAPGSKPYEEWLEQLNKKYGLDTDIFTGYVRWLGGAVRLDFGDSWKYTIPVTEKFGQVIWYSFAMNLLTLFVQFAIGIPLGILAARKQYSKTDYAVTVFALACISLPTFFMAMIFKYFISIKLGWLPLYGLHSSTYGTLSTFGKIADIAYHMILPVLTLTLLSIGGIMRYTRTNMLEVLNSDYIRTARAKGLPEKRVINKHAFRNTLIPLVTLMSTLLPSMFGGAMITETMYQIPGIGYISYQAIIAGDIPFSMFYLSFLLILTLISLILADIMYAVVDPRVRIN
ncbi:MAG TPA: ABC transporter permease [Clostridiales bacterium]|jgi:peptide/nickel transport system permease protein|nr:ABC transporter permease [Clostridiales bacterium]